MTEAKLHADAKQVKNLNDEIDSMFASLPESLVHPSGEKKYREISLMDYATLLALAKQALTQEWKDPSDYQRKFAAYMVTDGRSIFTAAPYLVDVDTGYMWFSCPVGFPHDADDEPLIDDDGFCRITAVMPLPPPPTTGEQS